MDHSCSTTAIENTALTSRGSHTTFTLLALKVKVRTQGTL